MTITAAAAADAAMQDAAVAGQLAAAGGGEAGVWLRLPLSLAAAAAALLGDPIGGGAWRVAAEVASPSGSRAYCAVAGFGPHDAAAGLSPGLAARLGIGAGAAAARVSVRLVRMPAARAVACRPSGAGMVNLARHNWPEVRAAFSALGNGGGRDGDDPGAAAAAAVYCVGDAVRLPVAGRALEVVVAAAWAADGPADLAGPAGAAFAVDGDTDVRLDLG